VLQCGNDNVNYDAYTVLDPSEVFMLKVDCRFVGGSTVIATVALVLCVSQETDGVGTSSGRMVTEGRKSDPDLNGIKVKGIIFSLPSCFNRHEISSG
jgi:hypothetical protein